MRLLLLCILTALELKQDLASPLYCSLETPSPPPVHSQLLLLTRTALTRPSPRLPLMRLLLLLLLTELLQRHLLQLLCLLLVLYQQLLRRLRPVPRRRGLALGGRRLAVGVQLQAQGFAAEGLCNITQPLPLIMLGVSPIPAQFFLFIWLLARCGAGACQEKVAIRRKVIKDWSSRACLSKLLCERRWPLAQHG